MPLKRSEQILLLILLLAVVAWCLTACDPPEEESFTKGAASRPTTSTVAPPKRVPEPPAQVEIAPGLRVSLRKGPAPTTSDAPPGTRIAHQQENQLAPKALQDQLFERVMRLEDVTTGRSLISVPGARAFFLPRDRVAVEGLVGGVEFGHLHPAHDGSLHLTFSPAIVERIERSGWGERHPRAKGVAMIYGPRNAEELDVVYAFAELAWRYARGQLVNTP